MKTPRLKGRLHFATCSQILQALGPRPGQVFALDASELESVDMAAWATLLGLAKRLQETGGSLKLVELPPHLEDTLRLLGPIADRLRDPHS